MWNARISDVLEAIKASINCVLLGNRPVSARQYTGFYLIDMHPRTLLIERAKKYLTASPQLCSALAKIRGLIEGRRRSSEGEIESRI